MADATLLVGVAAAALNAALRMAVLQLVVELALAGAGAAGADTAEDAAEELLLRVRVGEPEGELLGDWLRAAAACSMPSRSVLTAEVRGTGLAGVAVTGVAARAEGLPGAG